MKATSRWLPPLLGFLTAVGPLSTDMYLPAFPAIEADFGLPQGTAQITLASWFAGLAVGQITQGTLADRFGRRAPLIAGLMLYTVASIGCALSPSLTILTAMRAIAAFGGSASTVLPRAVVRDLADGHAAARLISQLMLVMGVAPILAPTLGGALLTVFTWHAIFWVATLHGVISLALVWRYLPETLPSSRRMRLGPMALVARYLTILRERSFLVNMGIGACAMFAMFAYISGSPPVYIRHYGLSPASYGVLYGICAAGFILGSQVNPRLLPRFGLVAVSRWALRVNVAAALVLAFTAFSDRFGLAGLVVPIVVIMTSFGLILPNTTVGALSRHSAHAGSASALMGTLQFLLAAVSGSLSGLLTDGTARPMAALLLLGSGCALGLDFFRPRPVATPVSA